MATLQDWVDLIGRILISVMFLTSGVAQMTSYDATMAYMEAGGVPGMLLPLVIALQILGPVAIIFGLWTRLFALMLAGFCISSAILFHFELGDRVQSIMFMKNLAIAGGFLILVSAGAGRFSLDNRYG